VFATNRSKPVLVFHVAADATTTSIAAPVARTASGHAPPRRRAA